MRKWVASNLVYPSHSKVLLAPVNFFVGRAEKVQKP